MLNIHALLSFLESIRFEHPHLIWLAIPGAIVTVALGILWQRGRLSAVKEYGDGDPSLVQQYTRLPGLLATALTVARLVLTVVLGCVTATMPYQPLGAVNVSFGALVTVAAFDTSRSMGAEGGRAYQPLFGGPPCENVAGHCGSRIDTAKLILTNEIMPALVGSKIGLLVYSGDYLVRSYANDDQRPLRQEMEGWRWLDVNSAPGRGSFVDRALAGAVDILERDAKQSPLLAQKQQDVILLFTDGGNDSADEDINKELAKIKAWHAKLLIVGIGSSEPEKVPLYDDDGAPKLNPDGSQAYFKHKDGHEALTVRDDTFMTKLAQEAGGVYLKVIPGQKLSIDWPTQLAGSKVVVKRRELFQFPLGAALLVLASIWLDALWSWLFGLLLASFGRRRTRESKRVQQH